jgi:hypothetical protein
VKSRCHGKTGGENRCGENRCQIIFLKSTRKSIGRGYESLDKEFQQVVREAEVGRRYVDKLVKVWTKAGVERWVLIHVEVQTTHDGNLLCCRRSGDRGG